MTVSVYTKAMALYNEKKYMEALSAFRNSLELGNDKSAYGLALCMKLGNGMFVDERSAKLLIDGYLERIEKCAREGDSEAQQVMGLYYADGLFAPVDREKAAFWLEKSAAQGDKYSRRRLKELKG